MSPTKILQVPQKAKSKKQKAHILRVPQKASKEQAACRKILALASLEEKILLTEIYKNIQTFTFQVLRGYSSWAFRNSAVQMLFSDTN